MDERILYAGSVHDEAEIEACVEVLRGGRTALRIGTNVEGVRAGGRRALRQAARHHVQLRLLGAVPRGRAARACRPGDEVVTSVGHVLDRRRADRAGRARPGVRRRRARHLQRRRRRDRGDDRARHRGDARAEPDRQRARLGPHPRHRRRARPAGDRGLVRRARRHVARHADRHPLRHQRHELRPVATSSPRPATAAWCCSTTTSCVDRCLLLRRWGRQQRGAVLRVAARATGASSPRSTASEYDNLFIFDELGWNFEPSELGAAFGLVQLDKLPSTTTRAASATSPATPTFFRRYPDLFELPQPDSRASRRLAHVPLPDPARVGVPAGRVPAADGGTRRRHPAWCGPATSPASR